MLRVRTGYSFRTAVGTIDYVMARLVECGYTTAPITDRASTFGWVKWEKAAKKAGLRPIFGVELAVVVSVNEDRPAIDYWTFLAIDDIAYVNKLVALSTQQFRYEPLLTYEQAMLAPGVIKIMGHRSNIDEMAKIQGGADIYLGISPSANKAYIKKAQSVLKVSGCAVSDNKYPCEGDKDFYEVVVGRNASTQTYPQHILTHDEWREAAGPQNGRGNPIFVAREIEGICQAKLKTATLLTPEKPKSLLRMCIEGAAFLDVDLTNPVYLSRMTRELNLIADKKFEDYFYIVADICNWARERMLVGPARGSSCGSLVCYLLGITTVDPIPYGLIFERFIDVNRDDLPDIDIDFSDQSRHLVFEYIEKKYGIDRVARLGTVALFKSKSAINEAGAALKIPRWECSKVLDSLIVRSSGDSRALDTLRDTLTDTAAGKELLAKHPEIIIAARMEGHPRHYSQHAAGVVISEQPISNYVAVDHRTGATMCDKKDAESLNLLKIDALGLTQLSVFEDALELAGLDRSALSKIPLDDPAAFKVLNDRKFCGIFQFNGAALQSIAQQFEINCFDDIVSITALARPGPLASGGATAWVKRRNKQDPVVYPHPVFEPYLKDTLGIVLYQEQVMEIGRNVGGLDWGQVTALRKAMSRSLGKEYFDQFGDPWKKGAIAQGVGKEEADKVWDDLCAYGAWSFNKSHSVAYGIISYQCAWLKAHHPFEFAAATLSHENDPENQIRMLREIHLEGYDYVPVDAKLSGVKWTVGYFEGKKRLVGPLSSVKGIGPKMMQSILGARARGERMPDRAQKLLADPKTTIDSLWPIRDAFARIMPDPRARNIVSPVTPIFKLDGVPFKGEVLLLCKLSKIAPRDENEAVNVARRGYKITDGQTASLNLRLTDDTGTVLAKIGRRQFPEIGQPIVDKGIVDKSLYAIKGMKWGDESFTMIIINAVRYIGEIDGKDQVTQ